MTTETRTFMGLDGYAGFRRDQVYALRFEVDEDGQVHMQLDHARAGVGPVVMEAAQFKSWFVK